MGGPKQKGVVTYCTYLHLSDNSNLIMVHHAVYKLLGFTITLLRSSLVRNSTNIHSLISSTARRIRFQ